MFSFSGNKEVKQKIYKIKNPNMSSNRGERQRHSRMMAKGNSKMITMNLAEKRSV